MSGLTFLNQRADSQTSNAVMKFHSPPSSSEPRILEEDADVDEDVARVLEGTDGDPDKIRNNVRKGGASICPLELSTTLNSH